MATGIYYEDLDEARLRCRGCIFKHLGKDQLFYVSDVFANPEGLFAQVVRVGKEGRELQIPLTSLQWDPFPLGWINTKTSAVYLQRRASRISRQGVTDRNLSRLFPTLPEEPRISPKPVLSFGAIVSNSWLEDALKGLYDTLDVALNKLFGNEQISSIALSRSYALVRMPADREPLSEVVATIHYKGFGSVADVGPKGEVVFYPSYSHLLSIFEREVRNA